MNNILIFSQDGNFTGFVENIAIGRRQETYIIGDKLRELLGNKKEEIESLIKSIGNSYRDNINRIINNQEIPKKQLLDKLIKHFKVEDDYFYEKELENIIITDKGIVVGKYLTNDKAKEIKQQLDEIIRNNYMSNKPIILNMPKEVK